MAGNEQLALIHLEQFHPFLQQQLMQERTVMMVRITESSTINGWGDRVRIDGGSVYKGRE